MRRGQSWCMAGALVAVVLMGARVSLCADETAAPKIEPKAAAVLQSLAVYFGGLKSVSVNATMNMSVEGPGMKQQVAIDYLIAAERPNKLAMVEKGSMMGVTVVSDGKQIYTYFPMMKMYTVKEAPADMDAIWNQSQTGSEKMLFIDTLLHNKPTEDVMKGVEEAKYVGEETVDGAQSNHIRIVTQDVDSDIWVSAGDKPILVKVVPDLMKALSKMGEAGQMKDMKMSVAISFKNWQMDTALPATTFVFEPPADAKKVDDFSSGMAEQTAAEKPAILGKPAPDFKLDLLGGGQLDLAAMKGKSIVILDFWATWCGPCQKATPILIAVATEYQAKGVRFYAVNEQEDEKTIQDFLKANGITCAVALDKDGAIGERYAVEGIPQTVVIGMDGTVQAVHVGFVPTLKDDLKKDLDQLLAGKRLAIEEPPKAETK